MRDLWEAQPFPLLSTDYEVGSLLHYMLLAVTTQLTHHKEMHLPDLGLESPKSNKMNVFSFYAPLEEYTNT